MCAFGLAGQPPDLRCAFSCFEEGTYVQHRGQGGWQLKLDMATVVKSVKPEDEIHTRLCKECKAYPIFGPCYTAPDHCQSCFEEKLDEDKKAKLSLCEPANVGPQLLTEGLVSTTNAEGLVVDEEPYEKKERDMAFPLEIMEKAYNKETQIEITKAQASVQDDFKRIINSINEVPVEMLSTHEPNLSHENCKEVINLILQVATLIAIAGEPGTAQHVCQGCIVAGSRQGR